MNRHYIPLCVFISACTTQYSLYIKPNDPWEPADENITPTDNITSDTPEDIVSDSDEPAVEETPVGDTDLVPSDTPIDTDIQHPTMDTYGNPLYPTVPEDFTDTGVVPLGVPGTIEDCNIPDDFMLVTYVDLDQDGFGSDPYTQAAIIGYDPVPAQAANFRFNVILSDTAMYGGNYGIDHFFSGWQVTGSVGALNPGIDREIVSPQLIAREAINIFPDIYNQSTGIGRFQAALGVINNEGGLPYVLTEHMAMTTHRKEFRDSLIYISEQRCASDNACFRTQFTEFAQWNPSRFGFSKNIFLTYTIWGCQGQWGCGYLINGSPYSATFWKGDNSTYSQTYDYTITLGCGWANGCGQASNTIDRNYDLDPQSNEGLFDCSWPGDDVDGDGFTLEEGDCHDGAAWINPAASEIPSNGADNNCDGYEDCFADNDGDGRAGLTNIITISGTDCSQYGRPTDCNDNNPLSYPGAPENSCDGIDQDCDGTDM